MAREMESAKFPSAKVADSDIGIATNREGKTLTASVPDQTSDTTIDLSGTNGIEQDEYGMLVGADGYEITRVKSVDANASEATVTREEDGTTSRSFEENDSFVPIVPAKTINQLRAEVVSMQDWMGADGDTWTMDRNIVLQPSTTDGTYPLTIDVLSGHSDPEPFIDFRRSTDSGDTYSSVGSIDYDPTEDDLELSGMSFVATSNSDIQLEDGVNLRFGTDDDLKVSWDDTGAKTDLATDNPLRLQRQASVSDGGALNSPTWAIEAKHDSDTSSSVSESTTLYEVDFVSQVDGSGNQTGHVRHQIAGTETLRFNHNQDVYVNFPANAQDLIARSQDSDHMLHVYGDSAPSGSQVSFGTTINQDWGTIFAGNRDASGAAEVDIAATLGEEGAGNAPTIDANNSEVWTVSFRPVTLDADTSTTVTDAGSIYVDGPPAAGTNVTITNQWLALFEDSSDANAWGVLDSGEVRVPQGPINLNVTGGGAIQDNGTDAITFDGSRNVTIPNGSLNLSTGSLDISGTTVFENDRDLAVDLIPNADNSLDLGSTSRRFTDAYLAGNVRTGTTAGNTYDLQARDTNAASWTSLLQSQAGNPPQLRFTTSASGNTLLEQSTADYTLTWNDPSAARTLTIPDPGENVNLVYQASSFGNDQVPFANTNGNLESSTSLTWDGSTLSASGTVDVGASGTGTLNVNGTTLFENDRDVAVDLLPNADASLDLGSATRQFQDAFLSSSVTLADTATLSWTTDSAIRRLAANDLGPSTDTAWTLEPADVSTDGGTANSPVLTLRAKHDSDTSTGVTSSSTDYAVDFVSQVSSGAQDGHIRHQVGGTEAVRLQHNAEVNVPQSLLVGSTGSPTGTLQSPDLRLDDSAPSLFIKDTSAPTDQGEYRLLTNDTQLIWQTRSDGNGAGSAFLRVERSGTSITDVAFENGNLGVGKTGTNFQLDQTGGTYAHLGCPSSAPTASNQDNGSVAFWVDEANNEFEIQIVDSNGNTLTGTVAVS